MESAIAVMLGGAFAVGLFSTALPWGLGLLIGLGVVGAIVAPFVRQRWPQWPRSRVWLLAGCIGIAASLYFQLRLPRPASTDISRFVSSSESSLEVLVTGKVTTLPRRTRSDKAQFWLKAQHIAPIDDGKPVTGKVYVTVPKEVGLGVQPGQIVRIGGVLYLPPTAKNPGGFDFRQYLLQEDCFAGLRGQQIDLLQGAKGWGWWRVQQRIVQAQAAIGAPEGALVSAMVLGGRTVDLAYEVKDAFVRVGLAHALAASGFQTSLILSVVLTLTRRRSPRLQFLAGSAALVGFVALAGAQPAILRAAVMGFGGLLALVLNRRTKPLALLLLTGIGLLALKPLWVFDLGFQLSFLATLGLLVTVPPLTRRLDWVPSAIAPLIAVPIAAYLWTLPVQLGAFGVLSPYSIPANLVTTPLISILSLGGMASALAALVWPPTGSTVAWCLLYPAKALIAIVEGFTRLPGNAYAVGTITVFLVLVLYLLLGLSSFQPWWQKRWPLALAIALVVLAIPLGQGARLVQVTVLDTQGEPLMVLRDRGRFAILGSSDAKTSQFTLLPFLQKTGINQIDWAIAPAATMRSAWATLAQRYPVKYLMTPAIQPAKGDWVTLPSTTKEMPLPLHQLAHVGQMEVQLLSAEPAIAHFTFHAQTWLWLGNLSATQQQNLALLKNLPPVDVLWWSSKTLDPDLVMQVRPKVAIASHHSVDTATAQLLQQRRIPLYVTGQQGAIQWTKQNGFQTQLSEGELGL